MQTGKNQKTHSIKDVNVFIVGLVVIMGCNCYNKTVEGQYP